MAEFSDEGGSSSGEETNSPRITATEVVEGEVDVTVGARRPVRVLIPAGVGVPGCDDVEVARAVVAEVLARSGDVPGVLDVSRLLGSDPELTAAVERRLTR